MKVTVHPAGGYKPMLPLDKDFKDCRGDNRTIYCFKAGKVQQCIRATASYSAFSYCNSVLVSVRLSVCHNPILTRAQVRQKF